MSQLKDIIAEEYKKCANDVVYFMKRYAKIQHPDRGKILFELFDFQEDTVRQFSQHDYNIILKSRQLGISTLVAGYALHMMLFGTDKNILAIGITQKTSKNLVTKVRVMYENLPSWLKTTLTEDTKLLIRFANGSQIQAVSAAVDSARSEALSLLILDEAAFIEDIEAIWAASQQTLGNYGSCIMLSTPNGVGNFFHKKWVDAKTGANTFNPIILPWTVHPERDQSWRDHQDILLGPKLATQECECNFISSGNGVIDGEILKWYEETYVQEPKEKRGIEDALWIWDYPDPTKTYIVTADVARGDGKDFSAFHVFDIDNIEQVAEYRGKLDTKSFGNALISIATEYNDALLVIENANIGWAVIQQVIDRGYQNLYYSYKEVGYLDPSIQLAKGYDLKSNSNKVPGFTTSSKTRPLIISKLETYFRERAPICKSLRLIEELYVFIWHGNKAQAQTGYNDDLVMSFAIGLWVRDTAIKMRQDGLMKTRMSLDYMKKTSAVYVPKTVDRKTETGWTQNMGNNKEREDLTWLLGSPVKNDD
jgi:hypothetical protein